MKQNKPNRRYFSQMLSGVSDGSTVESLPVADFTASPLTGTPATSIQFTDASTGTVVSYDWDFGDG